GQLHPSPPAAARRGGRLYRRRGDSAAAFARRAVPPRPAGRQSSNPVARPRLLQHHRQGYFCGFFPAAPPASASPSGPGRCRRTIERKAPRLLRQKCRSFRSPSATTPVPHFSAFATGVPAWSNTAEIIQLLLASV